MLIALANTNFDFVSQSSTSSSATCYKTALLHVTTMYSHSVRPVANTAPATSAVPLLGRCTGWH